ncbi:hypothetical protein BG015_000221, partial [Linnemannia schmuckeri]
MVSTRLFVFLAIAAALGVDTCNTVECREAAAGFLHDMNPSIDPCVDFEQFACGGFSEKMQIAEGNVIVSTFSVMQTRTNAAIRGIADASLGKAPKPAPGDTAATSNLKKLHDLFASCMDTDIIATHGRQPLIAEFNDVISTLPDVSASMDKTGLAIAIAKMIKLGVDPFIKLEVNPDLYNPLTQIISISNAGLSIPEDGFTSQEATQALENNIAIAFQKFLGPEIKPGAPVLTIQKVDKKWVAAAQKVVLFQAGLANAVRSAPKSAANDQGRFYNPWTIAKLNAVAPSIDWNTLIVQLLPVGEQYTRPLIANSPDYFTGLEAILKKTSSETLRYYAIYRIIENHAGHLSAHYSNMPLTADRASFCTGVINSDLGQIAGHYFVDQTLPEHSKIYFKSMIHQILASYSESMPKLDWLDTPTLTGAIKKLKAIVELVAESSDSPNTSSSESLQEYYSNLAINATDYFGNRARNSIWSTLTQFATVNKPVNKGLLPGGPPQTLNAFYGPQTNEIYFPAGLLQAPMFHANNPDYMNYGAMGSVAGHEIGWWTPVTAQRFEEKATCMVSQYSAYTVTGPSNQSIHLSGEQTLGENIADNGGIKYAFRAWHEAYLSDPQGITRKNFKLPGLEKYTPEQLFFVSFGRGWCEKRTAQGLADQVKTDSHSPARWRVIGAVQNSEDFARAFKCRKGTPMNPVNKCSLCKGQEESQSDDVHAKNYHVDKMAKECAR